MKNVFQNLNNIKKRGEKLFLSMIRCSGFFENFTWTNDVVKSVDRKHVIFDIILTFVVGLSTWFYTRVVAGHYISSDNTAK